MLGLHDQLCSFLRSCSQISDMEARDSSIKNAEIGSII
jgi:hypothetical protein